MSLPAKENLTWKSSCIHDTQWQDRGARLPHPSQRNEAPAMHSHSYRDYRVKENNTGCKVPSRMYLHPIRPFVLTQVSFRMVIQLHRLFETMIASKTQYKQAGGHPRLNVLNARGVYETSEFGNVFRVTVRHPQIFKTPPGRCANLESASSAPRALRSLSSTCVRAMSLPHDISAIELNVSSGVHQHSGTGRRQNPASTFSKNPCQTAADLKHCPYMKDS